MQKPLHLYKYRDLSTEQGRAFTKEIIVDKRVYFALPSSFNDPFEWRYTISTQPRNEQEKLMERPLANWGEYGANYVFPHMRKAFGVLSLSAKNDDILMWAHYANCHKGICIEFDASDSDSFFGRAKPVVYQSTYPELSIYSPSLRDDIENATLIKSNHWDYEEEYRVVDRQPITVTTSYPGHLLSGIILGCEISEENEKLIRSWLQQIDETVTIYRAYLYDNMYCLRIEPEADKRKSA